MNKLLRVAIPSPLRRLFDYLPPCGSDMSTESVNSDSNHAYSTNSGIGRRVKVPFGRRELIGVVLDEVTETDVPRNKLKPINEFIDEEPLLPSYMLELVLWAADYYQHPVGDAVLHALPALLRKGSSTESVHHYVWQVTPHANIEQLAKNASKLRNSFQIIADHPAGISREAFRAEGGDSQALKALFNKGLISEQLQESTPPASNPLKEAPLTLNPEQALVVKHLQNNPHFSPILLDGITGSGKTEVYLQAITNVLNAGQQALVLVPEIGLTPQTVQRFKQRFNVPIRILHSNLTDKQRLEAWLDARDGRAKIIIGTRSAIFTPLQNPGIIIIDEEHDGSFKQQEGFRYSARDLSVVRAHAENIPVILGSATPSLETLHNCQSGRYRHFTLRQRAGNAIAPEFKLLDIRGARLHNGLSEVLIEHIKAHIEQGTQVLVFINRRGFAPSLSCHDCGWIAECRRCDARMTLHYNPAHLHCHHCDSQRPIPARCDQCGSDAIKPQGAGTERTEQTLQSLFPNTSVLRIDRDSTSRKGSLDKLMEQVHSGEPCILVGTQMLAKGHHFPRVTLVAILDADGGLFSTDFRGMERTAQLITQVAGRAGRADHPGTVFLQTLHADHPLLTNLALAGYEAFAAAELTLRKQYQLAPFRFIAIVRAESQKPGTAESFLQSLREAIAPSFGGIDWQGPFPSPMEKKAGVFRSQLLLSCLSRIHLQNCLSHLCLVSDEHPSHNKVRWSVDVDPYDLY